MPKQYTALISLIFCLVLASLAFANNIEGTKTYKDYSFILVHGIRSSQKIFQGEDRYGNLKGYLEDQMGLKGSVFCYTFNDSDGSNYDHAKELADPANTDSWFNRAKNECKKRYAASHKEYDYKENNWQKVPDSVVPSKYILITHSMGGLAASCYIYSGKTIWKGESFYQNDVDKVVFVSTPLLGSDNVMAMLGFYIKAGWKGYSQVSQYLEDMKAGRIRQGSLRLDVVNNTFSLVDYSYDLDLNKLWNMLMNPEGDPLRAYYFAANIIDKEIWSDQLWRNGFGYNSLKPWWPGMIEMLPYDTPTVQTLTDSLKTAKLDDPTKEPAYSVVYGSGIPVADWKLSLSAMGAKSLNDFMGQPVGFLRNDYGLLSLPLVGQLPTNQAKVLAITGGEFFKGFMPLDGDALVPTYSSRGEGVEFLRNAKRYQHLFKTDEYERYLSDDFANEIAATEAAIAATAAILAMGGTPYTLAWNSLWWMRIPVSLELVNRTSLNLSGLWWDIEAHGHILEQYDLIRTAILDTPAIFTICDLQTDATSEALSSSEAGPVKSFTSGTTVPNGFESIKVKSLQEKRNAQGFFDLPVPMTLDGQRVYASYITVAKSPKRIAGKLNYLIPSQMKKFEYSLNFGAWQAITGVNPQTGEFDLENMPFAEGQNVLAIRSENAVGVVSTQHLTITLNTIPLLPSDFAPNPNSFTKNNQPTFKVKFAKAAYSSQEVENIAISAARMIKPNGEEINILPKIKTTLGGEIYDRKIFVEYQPDEPLPDGQYQILIAANSNIGVSQALWTVNIDTRGPTVAINPISPFSPRAPTLIKYSATDESSSVLGTAAYYLCYKNGNVAAQIGSDESVNSGEHNFPLDLEQTPDGDYQIKIKVSDLAGNISSAYAPITIDSTPPQILGLDMSPNPMTGNTTDLLASARVSEQSKVFIKLINTSNNGATTIYLAQANKVDNNYLATYPWKFDNALSNNIDDGIYNIEFKAIDEAGNESLTKTIEAFVVDRTAPTIYEQTTMPYVLSNSGSSPYVTTLSYRVNTNPKVKIKVFNQTTGQLVKTWDSAPNSINEKNTVTWSADSPELSKGSYKFQITAEDAFGNQSTAFAYCVKDGIAPVISFPPENNYDVSGIISIRGTAVDPDWTNDKPFKQYRVYCAKGTHQPTIKPEQYAEAWKTEAVSLKDQGLKPVQNDSTLAYLNTNYLDDGEYTILIVVDEEGGESQASVRIVNVNNQDESQGDGSKGQPYVKLNPLPPEIDFTKNDATFNMGFLNSVKPANVYIEIENVEPRRSAAGSEPASEPRGSVVFNKYFPNVDASIFSGKPNYRAGADLGYFIWADPPTSSGQDWHIKYSSDGRPHRFSGSVIAIGGTTSKGNLISWDTREEGEIDFTTGLTGQTGSTGKQIMIIPKIDEDPLNPSPYASNVYLGITKATKDYLPIMADLQAKDLRQETRDLAWDGKLDTGAYVDSGYYKIKARAEGADGFGIATDEAQIYIKTPYELANVEALNKTFSSLSVPDRISVSYNVSKDSLVSAYVYDENGSLKSTILSNEKVLGSTNPNNRNSFSWKGNYPDNNSGTILTSGRYSIKLIAKALDGTDEKTQEIKNITIIPTFQNEKYAKLDPIGSEAVLNGQKVMAAQGESPYYFEAKASGFYYPPKEFGYTLSASGEQRFTTYPYVPFAGLMHRYFKQANVHFKVYLRVNAYYEKKEWGYKNGQFNWWDAKDNSFDLVLEGDKSFTSSDKVFEAAKNIPAASRCPEDVAGNTQNGAVTGVVVKKIEVWSQGDSPFALDIADGLNIMEENKYCSFGKGIFVLQNAGQRVNRDYDVLIKIKLPDESPIEYSRLTNRYVPWVGFVNKNNPELKDFSAYLFDIQKGLGFPGAAFFNDKNAKLNSPCGDEKTITGKINAIPEWENKIKELNRIADEGNLLGYNDALSSSAGYDKYLSEGHLQFIPITAPEGGQFESLSDSKYIAKTDLALSQKPEPGKSQTPFVFGWPNPDFSDFDDNYSKGSKNASDIIKNPQLWNGCGDLKNLCFYELDQNERTRHSTDKSSFEGRGQTIYYKDKGKSEWELNPLSSAFDPPDYIEGLKYIKPEDQNGIRFSLVGNDRNGKLCAENTLSPVQWTTLDDDNLAGTSGLIKSGWTIFNPDKFESVKNINIFSESGYKISNDTDSSSALKYIFIKSDRFKRTENSPCANPNLSINKWDIYVKDRNGQNNADFTVSDINLTDDPMKDSFNLKLKANSSEKRYVEIRGEAAGPYEIMYFDGSGWQKIVSSDKAQEGTIAWWNVSRLNGKYTVLLRSENYVSTQDIYIGTFVKNDNASHEVSSAYGRARLSFPAGAFLKDELATITPVTMSEIKIRNKPIILTHGPIVEIRPSPYKFKNPKDDGIDLRPTLCFYYTLEDLKTLGLNPDPANPAKNLGLNIHQITASGDLQVIDNNLQSYDKDSGLYCFSGPLGHFSTYTLAKGKISLSAPIVLADRYITNKETVTIYGTAEAGANIDVYIMSEPASEPRGSGEDGKFRFENVPLLNEGENHFNVVSYFKETPDFKTQSDITIIKDTIPPIVSAEANLAAFSPNGDGKYDSVDYLLRTNENGKVCLQISMGGKQLKILEISAEAYNEIKVNWSKDGFTLYKRDKTTGDWGLVTRDLISENYPDGEYQWVAYAIDEAGNISNNIAGETIVDTTPPKILNLLANPNPFTPNSDGIRDTTKFWYKLSEPSYADLNIYREDGQLYRNHLAPTSNFEYPNSKLTGLTGSTSQLSQGDWLWDGRGARNELLGGSYKYYIKAEDWVGNSATSEYKTITVDCQPSLVPYAYADPDPFSAVNPDNNFTQIKYYLSRDNTKVDISIIGRENQTIKKLVSDTQKKGEHFVKWQGDYDYGYKGPYASANSQKVADGTYEFHVTAEDLNENKPNTASNTVVVDNVPPHISLSPVAVNYLSKEAVLTYSIPEKASVEVSVYDLNNNFLGTLSSSQNDPGVYTVIYKDQMGQLGQKYFRITAQDPAKNKDEQKTEMFSLGVTQDIQITNLSVSASPFTPNSDGIKDLTRVSYQLSGGAPPYQTDVYVVNSGGATIRKIISSDPQNLGSHSFYWDGKIDSPDPSQAGYAPDGEYRIIVSAKDSLENMAESSVKAVSISTKPVISLSAVKHSSPESVFVSYSIDYPIAWISDPAAIKLDILNSQGINVLSQIWSNTPGSYSFLWDKKDPSGQTIPDGTYYLFLNATDSLGTSAMAANTTISFGAAVSNPDNPSIPELLPNVWAPLEIVSAYVSPNPAKAGPAYIDFTLTPEAQTARVSIAQNGAAAVIVPAASYEAGKHRAIYNVAAGFDGIAVATIEAWDGHGQYASYLLTFEADTYPPNFTNIRSTVNNQEFAKYAKSGAQAAISFNSSEPLKFNPDVKINNNPAKYDSQITIGGSIEYTYKYDISPIDISGTAEIYISGYDAASNLSENITTSESESFFIDLKSPVVEIASPETEMIANPSPIKLNGSETDGAKQTTLYFKTSKYGKASVKVYKVDDSKAADQLTRADFMATSLVSTCVDSQWLDAGAHAVFWGGAVINGRAEPGQYAFVVEISDRAGNIGERLWGGTVWVQNNVLKLKEPSEVNEESNPRPKYIASNPAKMYFWVDAGVTPKTVNRPEGINILGAENISWEAATKSVGYYSVKVYSRDGALIKTLAQNKEVQSCKELYELWDGTDEFSQAAPDGKYKIVVSVADYNGSPAIDNVLTREVVVDRTPPKILTHSINNYYFSPVSSNPDKRSTTISYEVWDNNEKLMADVGIYKSGEEVFVLSDHETIEARGVYGKIWDGGGASADGEYTCKIQLTDFAGNTASAEGRVFLDKTPPIGSIKINNNNLYTKAASVELGLACSDDGGSGINQASFSNDGINWTAWENILSVKIWGLSGEDGQKHIFVRYSDLVENYTILPASIVLDTTAPYFDSLTITGPSYDGSWSKNNTPSAAFSAGDMTSGINSVEGFIDGASKGDIGASLWFPTIADGQHSLKIRAHDKAGNYFDSSVYNFKIDTTSPNAPSLSISETPINSWSSHNSPQFSWGNPGDGNGSGVSSYRGFIDGSDQGAVTSGWHPTLSDGTHSVYIRAVDGVGLTNNSSTYTFKIDTQPPSISNFPSSASFNPYLGTLSISNASVFDPSPSSGITTTYRIEKSDGSLICNPAVSGGTVTWNGQNNSGDYVNEGRYYLKVRAVDGVGLTCDKVCDIDLWDDQYITDGIYPGITIDGNLCLKWVNGYRQENQQVQARGAGTGGGTENKWIFLENNNCAVRITAAHDGGSNSHAIYRVSNNGDSNGSQILWWENDNTQSLTLDRGWYRIYASCSCGWPGNCWSSTTASWSNILYKKYSKTCGQEFEDNIGGAQISGPTEDPLYSGGPTSSGNHQAWTSGGNIYYRRGNSSDVKIASAIEFGCASPAIAVDSNGNAYVAWSANTGSGSKIYFQKIPSNFAPVKGTISNLSVNIIEPIVSKEVTLSSLSSPILIDPSDNSTIKTLRPNFKWQGIRNVCDYQINVSRLAGCPVGQLTRILAKTITQSEAIPVGGDNPNISCSINEYDEGLERGTWYWRVLSSPNTINESSSDIWSFTIDPPLSLSGITNYPNPFAAGRESTKIRYRLSRDADEVKIAIYNVAGSKVAELDGLPYGEGPSIWQKYNDVAWDGRNGNGVIVLNGIYPFEVIARIGNDSVSGRGKIAVLK